MGAINLYFDADCNRRGRAKNDRQMPGLLMAARVLGWQQLLFIDLMDYKILVKDLALFKRFIGLGLWLILGAGWAMADEAQSTADGLADEPRTSVKIAGVDPRFRVAQDYFAGLLQKALIRGADGRKVPVLLEQQLMEQERATQELIRGRLLDVYWMGTDNYRESNLRAIRIPLTRGLLGYRRFIISKDDEQKFESLKTLDELSKLMACQGKGWPDTLVLRAAGLRVREIIDYDHIFKSLNSGACDYFPRGYFEVPSELQSFTALYPKLTNEKSILLHYPFALYFFVNRNNEDLALWIERGLERMIDSGEFMAFMHSQALTKSVFPLKLGNNWRVFDLVNGNIPRDTDYQNPRYWFQPEDFVNTVEQP